MADDERARLITDVEQFTRKYDGCQRLITCRLAANDYLLQGYTYVEMADFDEKQIREFVARWFAGDKHQRERRELFLLELDKNESEGLRELARVPLLLALLCLSFEETLKLSSRRVELYEDALEALLKKWDSGRNIRRDEIYRVLSLKRKEQMLAEVAAETFYRSEYFIPKKTLAHSFETFLNRVPIALTEIDGEAVLQTIIAQHGLFVERSHDIYSFAHLTFQEYLTAQYVVENEARGTLQRLIVHFAYPRYREIFLITAALLPDASKFFEYFTNHLAAEAKKRPAIASTLSHIELKAATAVSGETMQPVTVRSAYLSLTLDMLRAFSRTRVRTLDRQLARALDRTQGLDRVLDRTRDLTMAWDRALELARAHANDLTRVHTLALDQARDRPIDRDPARASILDRKQNRSISLDRDLARARSRARDHAQTLAHVLAHSPYAYLARDIALSNTWIMLKLFHDWPVYALPQTWHTVAVDFLTSAISQSRALNDQIAVDQFTELAVRLNSPTGEMNRRYIERLIGEFEAILQSFDNSFTNLHSDDLNFISMYVSGNLLLIDCLDLAVVADRDAIKEQLLLLPEV